MDYWELLGIAPSNNTREIKRAYAKKLKTTRPDEKPKEFQALHQAYKIALGQVQRVRIETQYSIKEDVSEGEVLQEEQAEELPPSSVTVTEDSLRDNSQQTSDVYGADPPVPLGGEDIESAQAREMRLREESATQILENVDKILQSRKQLNRESTWHFLADCPYLLEEDFNWELGLGVMYRIAVFNKGETERSRRHYVYCVTDSALSYLDMLFDWQGNEDFVFQQMDAELCQPIFTLLQEVEPVDVKGLGVRGAPIIDKNSRRTSVDQTKQLHFGNLFVRTLALVLDYLGVVILLYLIVAIGYASDADVDHVRALAIAVIFGVIGYVVMAFLMEASSYQATPFKMLFGLRVTNRKLEKISYFHNFFRIVCFLITVPFQKIAWFVNCFLGGKLIHDRMSRTYVLDTRKSI